MRHRPTSIHLAAAVGCLVVGLVAAPSPANGGEPGYQEVGSPAGPPEPGDSYLPVGLDVRLEVMADARSLDDREMDATYGIVPGAGLGVSIATSRDSWFLLRLRYLTSSGNPYHDIAGYESGREARLAAVPLTMGFRANLARHPRFRFNIGTAFSIAWIRERLPDPLLPEHDSVYSGHGSGLSFWAGPEILFAHGRRSVAMELGWGGFSARLDGHAASPDTDLTGLNARVLFSFALQGDKEVSR